MPIRMRGILEKGERNALYPCSCMQPAAMASTAGVLYGARALSLGGGAD